MQQPNSVQYHCPMTQSARRIEDMSNDIREQLIEFVKKSPYYALQLDESTDIAGQAQLLTYVRYLAGQGD